MTIHRIARFAAVLAALFALAVPAAAQGVHIQLMCSTASRSVIQELVPQFERATGNKVDITYGVANLMLKQMEEGEQFDAALLLTGPMNQLFQDGKLAAGTRIEPARMPMAIGIPAGGKKYDISTLEAFKKTMADAKSIVYSGPGSSGVYFAALLKRLGLFDTLQPKLIAAATGDAVGQTLAEGKAEIGILPPSELLPVKGVEVMALFPEEIQNYDKVVGGVSANARQPEAAKALLAFLMTPAARQVFVNKGMEPL